MSWKACNGGSTRTLWNAFFTSTDIVYSYSRNENRMVGMSAILHGMECNEALRLVSASELYAEAFRTWRMADNWLFLLLTRNELIKL